jgi:hypothetical protein
VLWIAGGLFLLVGALAWILPARPYEAPWAWISFIGMCIIDDYLMGPGPEATWPQLPKLTLLAAVIVFRRHPELTLVVVLVSAPLVTLLKRQALLMIPTTTAHWTIAAVLGAALFRAVGFETTAQFVAATIVLVALYYVLGPLLGAWFQARLGGVGFAKAFGRQRRFALTLELTGVLLALAWRTASLQPAALKLADGALVALAGIAVGTLLGSSAPTWLFKTGGRIPQKPALLAGGLLLIGLLAPRPFSWMLPLILAIVAGVWALSHGAYSILCCATGAFANEVVRAFNGGFMPVEGSGLMSGFGAANTYVHAGPGTLLSWLDDRLYLPPPFPGIASAGDVLIALGMAWLVGSVVARRHGIAVADSGESRRSLEPAA